MWHVIAALYITSIRLHRSAMLHVRAPNVACGTLCVSRGVLYAARSALAHGRRMLCTSMCSEPHLATLFYAYGGVEAAQRQLEEWVEWHSQVQSIPLEYY